jgi:hypothetical protein
VSRDLEGGGLSPELRQLFGFICLYFQIKELHMKRPHCTSADATNRQFSTFVRDRALTGPIAVLVGVLFLVLLSSPVQGQLTRGAVAGTVRDTAGAVVAGANVTVTNNSTKTARTVTTDANGFYRIGALDPGSYSVTVEAPNFSKAENRDLVVSTASEVTYDVEMKAGSVTETVDVTATAEAVTLNKTNATVGTTIESRRAVELPLGAARNVNNLALLSPNVFSGPGSSGISANGQRARNNNFTIDGSDNNDISVTISTTPVIPEAVQEFQIQTNPYSAENGRNTGAAINVLTRSGTNAIHGAVWDYYRGSDLNAMDNVEKRSGLTKPSRFNRNQYGFSVGGPVFFPHIGEGGDWLYDGRNRTYFFFLYQGDRTRTGLGLGNAVTLPVPGPEGFDRLRTVPLRSGQSAASRQAMLDAISFLQGIYSQNPTFGTTCRFASEGGTPRCPTANGVEIRTAVTNLGISQPTDEYNYTFRLDHRIDPNNQLTGRYIQRRQAAVNQVSNLDFGSLFAGEQLLIDHNLALSEVHIFSPQLLNEFRFSYVRRNLNFPENDPKTSTTTIGGLFTFGGLNNFPQFRISDFYQFADTLTWTLDQHTLKFGFDIRRNLLHNFSGFDVKGTFNFANLQEYLNNNASIFTQALTVADFNAKQWQQAYFVQDDWRVWPSLTLNLGLRYETANAPLGFFGTDDPAQNAALIPHPVKRDKNNWAPVVGFAYSPRFKEGMMGRIFGNGLSVVRGGYRTAYDVLFYNILTVNAANFPISTTFQRNNILDVYPNLAPPTTVPTFSPSAAFVNSPEDMQNPESYLYSLSFQREIARQLIVEVGYSGSRSVRQINQLQANPAILTPTQISNVLGAAQISATQFRCPSGIVVTAQSDCAGSVTSRRIFPQFGSRTLIASGAQSKYNAGYLQVRKRMSNNFSFDIAYTYSKLLSDNDESLNVGGLSGTSPQVPQDFLNYKAEESLSVFDRTHRFVINYLYEVPLFGSLKNNALAKLLLGGFQISGITSFQSGQPFTIITGVDSNGNGTATGDRPNLNPGGILILDPVTNNFRTFTSPLVGGRFFVPLGVNNFPLANSLGNGNLGKNTFRAPGFWNSDISVMKRFYLPWGGEDKHRFEVRADFLNAFNQDNYGIPVTNMNSTNFGKNLNNWGNRSIPLSGKYVF